MKTLLQYCKDELLPYMTRKSPNTRHSTYCMKRIIEKEIDRYIPMEELQQTLLILGYPVSDYYPISETYFKEKGGQYNG